jgi:epoxyqueuosine reductase
MLTAALIRERALELGFDAFGVAPLTPGMDGARFLDWLAQGNHAGMGYMARPDTVAKRLDPTRIFAGAQSIVMVALSYETLGVPMTVLTDPLRGRIARYAWGADYHDVITPVLKAFGAWIAAESRAYVDTGPVLERAWAERCGLGFIGKNTCLIDPRRGSFFFLGAVLVGAELEPDPAPITKSCGCGNCTRCLTACPTQAFVAPGVLDARRCISYWTIEAKDEIPEALRTGFGNWIFGCDVCQDVCPYVKRFGQPGPSAMTRQFTPMSLSRAAPLLDDVLRMTPDDFTRVYDNTPLARTGWSGLLRNACIAAGNSRVPELFAALHPLADSSDPLIRNHAEWAIKSIDGRHVI